MMNQLINIEITNTKTDIQKLLDVFQKYGVTTTHPIDYEKFVKLDERYLRPSEVDSLLGDPSKAKRILQWTAQTNWKTLAEIMVKADIKLLEDKLSGKRIDV